MGILIGIGVVIGIIVLFTNSKNKKKSEVKTMKNNNRHKKHPPKIVLTKNSEDFYNTIFNALLETGNFCYPKYSKNQEGMLFAILGDGRAWVDKNNRSSEVAMFVFYWLKYVYLKNKLVYSQILNMVYDNKQVSIQGKINYMQNTIRSEDLKDLLSAPQTIDAIYKRVRVSIIMINRLTNRLLSFWIKYDNDKIGLDSYISKVNKDYTSTDRITKNNLTINEIERIFLRDMLSGKLLMNVKTKENY